MALLTQEQDRMIDEIIKGTSIAEIARLLTISRQTIYVWLRKDYISAELENRRKLFKKRANDNIVKDVNTYVDNIKLLANGSKDEKIRLQANKYLIDRALGVPTKAEHEEVNNTGDKENINGLKDELKEIKKAI